MSAMPVHPVHEERPRRRGGLAPAIVTSVLFALSLVALQLVSRFVWDDEQVPVFEAGALRWLVQPFSSFWGVAGFETEGRLLVGNLVGGIALVVLVVLLGWLGLRGLAPGSSFIPAFLVLWMATVLAAVLAQAVLALVRAQGDLGIIAGPLVSGALQASVFGFKWGWAAGLVGALVWLAARPPAPAFPATRAATYPATYPAGTSAGTSAASHQTGTATSYPAPGDTLPGGHASGAPGAAPTESRSSRAPDAGEASAEGPDREPR